MPDFIQIPENRRGLVTFMLCSSILCVLLIILRVSWSFRLTYAFLCWNLFLAWIPMLISFHLHSVRNKVKAMLLFGTWLLFFPNCPYILTDFLHLAPKPMIPLWFDLFLILSFAWNGLMMGFISLFEIHHFLEKHFNKLVSRVLIIFSIMLGSFGIYLGRFQRWNSWDVLLNPLDLMYGIAGMVIHPFTHPRWLGVTLLFSLFLSIGYFTLVSLLQSGDEKGKANSTEL